MKTTVEVQYAVRYGDGEIDNFEAVAASVVEDYIKDVREGYGLDLHDPEDYEPMSIVRRTITTTVWAEEWQTV